jgi:uncharacterized protein YkwD
MLKPVVAGLAALTMGTGAAMAEPVKIGMITTLSGGGAGLGATRPDPTLERAAEQQARLMAEAGRMEHTARRGQDFSRRMRGNGIGGRAAENIAHGRMPLQEVFAMWQASPPHRKNMLTPGYTRHGLASATAADGRRYWALILAD